MNTTDNLQSEQMHNLKHSDPEAIGLGGGIKLQTDYKEVCETLECVSTTSWCVLYVCMYVYRHENKLDF